MIIVRNITIGSMDYFANGELLKTNIRLEYRKTSDSNHQSLRVVIVMTISGVIYFFESLQTYIEIDFGGDIHHQ